MWASLVHQPRRGSAGPMLSQDTTAAGLGGSRMSVDQQAAEPFLRCRTSASLREACAALVDELHERWELPSLYLLIDGRLRCQASRGYFQVSDGFAPTTGVIGRVVGSGTSELLADVTSDPAFVAAIPGLLSEACAPVWVHGRVQGAVNLESRSVLGPEAVVALERAAAAIGSRLEELGGLPPPSLAERLSRIAVTLAGQTTQDGVRRAAVDAALEISGMETAALARVKEGRWEVRHAAGPLASLITAWDQRALTTLARWVRAGTTSYFPDGEDVPPGFEFLGQGLHALSLQPLVVSGEVVGLLIVADSRPAAHDPALTAALELLASQTAATLGMVRTLDVLAHQASSDPLTGLVNRRRLLECLAEDVATERRSALVLLDLDGFKGVNDLHGHAEGDLVLVGVGRRLQAAAREGDVVCRLGGDEFAVLAREITGRDEAAALGHRLLDAVSAYDGGPFHPTVGASIGVRLTGDATSSTMLVDADTALYAAKHRGRSTCVVWEPALRTETLDSGALVDDLLVALARGDLDLRYNPVVATQTGLIDGAEGVARWTHARRGLVPTGLFLAAAERAGAVGQLTRWGLQTAARDAAHWPASVQVGLSVGGAELAGRGLVDEVRRALDEQGLPPERLVLEVTRRSWFGDCSVARQSLTDLADLGVRLALDDVGGEHADLGVLRSLPFHLVKLDAGLVAQVGRGDQRAVAVVDGIGAFARRLDLQVVAKGVRDRDLLARLAELGCGFAQGLGLSTLLTSEEVSLAARQPGPWIAPVVSLPAPRPPTTLAPAQ